MDSPVFGEMLTQQAQTTDALSPAISGHALIPGSQCQLDQWKPIPASQRKSFFDSPQLSHF